MKSQVETYYRSVKNNFKFLKNSLTIKDAYLRSIDVPGFGYLVPLGNCHREDLQLFEQMTQWRNKFVDAYPTQFKATLIGTKFWVKHQVLDVEDRILFLVVDNLGYLCGHIGFNGCFNDSMAFEIDNVVNGNPYSKKGIMSHSQAALIEWARQTINVDSFFLRVMAHNDHAIKFYKVNNFVEIQSIPLVEDVKENITTYRPAEDGEVPTRFFLKMIYQANSNYVNQSLILTAGPSISAKEGVYTYDAAKFGWNNQWSKYLLAFEKNMANYVGVKYALATSSCTGGLQISLMALDIGPKDEVIVPDLTWVATANAVRYVGATPIFADVELDSWNIDPRSVEPLITKNTKAIIVVHMYGHPARMSVIKDIAQKYKLRIIEDAAPAIGAEWGGQRCGSFGDFASFSFQGAKLLVTGEGGMLVTNNEKLYIKAKKIWDQGRNPNKAFWIDTEGVKFKMSNVQAAIGLAQLERADELIAMKRRIFSWYYETLKDIDVLEFNKEVENAKSIYWMTSIRLKDEKLINRDTLISRLRERNVDTRPVFPSISQYPIWDSHQKKQPTADLIGRTALNLPSGVTLSKVEVDYVCSQIRQLLSQSGA